VGHIHLVAVAGSRRRGVGRWVAGRPGTPLASRTL